MFLFFVCSTFVIAAVKVVLPWSMCPIVPMFTCGFVRSYFAFAMSVSFLASASAVYGPARCLGGDLFRHGGRHFLVARELHGVSGATLGHGPHVGCVTEHVAERHVGADDLGGAPDLLRDDAAAAAVEVADDRAHVVTRGH